MRVLSRNANSGEVVSVSWPDQFATVNFGRWEFSAKDASFRSLTTVMGNQMELASEQRCLIFLQ